MGWGACDEKTDRHKIDSRVGSKYEDSRRYFKKQRLQAKLEEVRNRKLARVHKKLKAVTAKTVEGLRYQKDEEETSFCVRTWRKSGFFVFVKSDKYTVRNY